MQPIPRKTSKPKFETKKDEAPSTSKKEEKKLTPSTPRNFVQKSSTSDIYGQRKQVNVPKTPKKALGANKPSVSPMKDLLKSSPSSVSHRLKKEAQIPKDVQSASNKKITKNLFVNVTVNSPIVKRKLSTNETLKSLSTQHKNNSQDRSIHKERNVDSRSNVNARDSKVALERERTKTRTLDENEAKILTSDSIDNNKEMLNLSQKLRARPKSFFVELDDEKKPKTDHPHQPSDEEVSYEDDFESYESDFESYHSENNDSVQSDEETHPSDHDLDQSDDDIHRSAEIHDADVEMSDSHVRDVKDEERMLDSGSYDLRDRSAKSKPAVMEFILEDSEDPNVKKPSFTDEGFQEMSSSSAVSSLKTVHVEVLERPLFIDFTKSKENKRRRIINERLKQRAADLLNMITLHEMSYTLFEMKPVSYDLYMATFGRNNYTQTAVQTFDDGVEVEIQTDSVDFRHVWTQNPVEFSKSDITIKKVNESRKYSKDTVEFINQFTFLTENIKNDTVNSGMENDLNYETNPLRMYFEQKNGVGTTEMLPYDMYNKKLENTEHNPHRLRKFLKRMEGKINSILNLNTGNTELCGLRNSKLPYSKGFVPISVKNIQEEKYSVLNNSKISKIIYSHTKNSLLLTVSNAKDYGKCVVCLWDLSVARNEPVKILIAIDNVNIGLHRGSTDGVFVACLDDGSLHLWDLSEEPNWHGDVASEENSTKLVEVGTEKMTAMERDLNLKNSIRDKDACRRVALQSCAYTNSGYNLSNGDHDDRVVGLEWIGDARAPVSQDGGRKLIGQVATLQSRGMLTTWSIIQEKSNNPDIGKAYWSKMKLERAHSINLTDCVDAILENSIDNKVSFNLSLAKRRLAKRKLERSFLRPKSAVSVKNDIDRPSSAASVKNRNVLPVQNSVHIWENIMIFNDIKIVNVDVLVYIVAKNNGEILCCSRIAGVFKAEKMVISHDTSSVITLAVSPHNLPYFLAATDSGTVSLCSLVEKRVLLTLDCRNISPIEMERIRADHKGRYISSVSSPTPASGHERGITSRISIKSIQWSAVNPCCFYALLKDGALIAWDLMQSDIYAKVVSEQVSGCVASGNNLALLNSDGEVQLHRLNENRSKEYLELFQKYVALL